VNWVILSKNPNAIHILKNNLDKVDWNSCILNPNAIHILEQNLNKVTCLCLLSSTNNAIHLVAPLNHQQMKENNREFFEELVSFVCHPNWLNKCASRLNLDFMEYQALLMECGVF
jgi:hypothetical protein